jgi:amino acid transporter
VQQTLPNVSLRMHNLPPTSPPPLQGAVQAAGPLYALLGFALLPFLWSVPEALVCAELASAFPENAGYVVWVEAAFGPFAGFLEGLFSWVSGVTDNTIYPVMFITYLQVVFPELEGWWLQKCAPRREPQTARRQPAGQLSQLAACLSCVAHSSESSRPGCAPGPARCTQYICLLTAAQSCVKSKGCGVQISARTFLSLDDLPQLPRP